MRARPVASLVAAAALVLLVAPDASAGQTFTVTSTQNSGDGSLRQAIKDANATMDADTIRFGIDGGGVHTIKPRSALPVITAPVTIDGTTQHGFAGTPVIELNGTNADGDRVSGLVIQSNNVVIRGLAINRFSGDGIDIYQPSGSAASGGVVVAGNFIGTNAAGTVARPNAIDGVIVEQWGALVGGTSPADRNIISGNEGDGVVVFGELGGSGPTAMVQGNFIGTDVTGLLAIPNHQGVGVNIEQGTAQIGGTQAGSGNLVSGNETWGVRIYSKAGSTAQVRGNRIGLTSDGKALGNGTGDHSGIRVDTADRSVEIRGNVISRSSFAGIDIADTATGVTMRRNAIFLNDNSGIYLEPGGALGGNDLQPSPTLTRAHRTTGGTTVSGTMGGSEGEVMSIEVRYSKECDPNGYGEGHFYLGTFMLTVEHSGTPVTDFTQAFPVKVPAGDVVTALATDPDGNTSSFSNCEAVTKT